MNWIDFWVVVSVVIVVGLIAYFGPIRRRLDAAKHGGQTSCPNCPVGNDKKVKRMLKDYRKAKEKENKKKDCCK
jgi:hypothetical protein